MVQIANLVLGLEFKDLLVEVTEVGGIDPESKPEDPAHTAIVGDATGHISLVYRAATAVRPTVVKKGKTYSIAGKVTSHNGHVQIQIGSSWGKISLINGQTVPHIPPYCEATDLSAPERRYGAVLLRSSSDVQQQAFVCSSGKPLPSVTCTYMETDRTAACRALEAGLEMLPSGFRLLPVAPIECYERSAQGIVITSIFAAVDTNLADKFSIGALGQWLPVPELLQKVSGASKRCLQTLLQQLQHASAVGLITLKITGSAAPAHAGASSAVPADRHDAHGSSPASHLQQNTLEDEGSATASEDEGRREHGTASAPREGQGAAEKKATAARRYPEWRPGQMHAIKGGGAEAQSLLDRLEANTGIAIVVWFAGWAESCRASIPALERQAAERSDVPFLLLDVEAPPTNRALAMEKALTRPQSQRRAAKPVLRGEQKFPAFSLHIAPSLQPQEMFTGPSALKDLGKALAGHPTNAPMAAAASSDPAAEVANGASARPSPSKPGPKAAADKARLAVGVIKRGAPDLKQKLQDASEAGQPMAVLWTSAAMEAACEPALQALMGLASSCTAAALYEAPSDMSKANGMLAEALGVKRFPILQVFRDMKVQQSISDCSAESLRSALQAAAPGDAPPSAAHEASARLEELALGTRQTASAANEALEEFGPTAHAAYLQPGLATRDRQTAPAAHDMSDRSEKSEPAAREKRRASTVHEAPEKSESAADSAAAQSGTAAQHPKQDDSHFAPLMGKEATSGAQQSMPGGKKGCFWPKMPCLRCGCPWYSGEDWDAVCMRCGWDCQISGYDDESQPLPPFRAQWQEFTAVIKQGRTPEYNGKRTQSRQK